MSQLAVALGEQVVPNVIHVPRADGAELLRGIRVSALERFERLISYPERDFKKEYFLAY